ncbi:Wzz/FepE/Etk N-terminal domain-containing protein, partial [Nonomuraea sp. NPDC049784]|uniref:Wzz/FepE/Etk N-terminal domain-containing protein n=1 Tax=Nonomuraea sp. NPDC049784 TaxID=3154361 RepID=UPI00340AB899
MSSGTDLDEHLSLLRRRWLLLVGCVVLGGTAGLALMRLTPPSYTATTQVLVMPVGSQEPANQVTSRQREPLNLDTEAQVAQSAVVGRRPRPPPRRGGTPPRRRARSSPPRGGRGW